MWFLIMLAALYILGLIFTIAIMVTNLKGGYTEEDGIVTKILVFIFTWILSPFMMIDLGVKGIYHRIKNR